MSAILMLVTRSRGLRVNESNTYVRLQNNGFFSFFFYIITFDQKTLVPWNCSIAIAFTAITLSENGFVRRFLTRGVFEDYIPADILLFQEQNGVLAAWR